AYAFRAGDAESRMGMGGREGAAKARAPGGVRAERKDQLRASPRDLAGTNFTTLRAAIWILAPVCGLRPVRAARSLTLSLPRPGRVSSSPCSRASRVICAS